MSRPCEPGKVRNPLTNRCVKVDGRIGKKIVASSPRRSPPRRQILSPRLLRQEVYQETIDEIARIAKAIKIGNGTQCDGRIESAVKEKEFLEKLENVLLKDHPSWSVTIAPIRAACDILVNHIRINLKLTECKSSDNSANKPSIFYSITGNTEYPYSTTWNDFWEELMRAKQKGSIKTTRNKSTEYHYLVKNKINDDVLLKPIFDIHTYVSNPSNDLQINWKNEFKYKDYVTQENDYHAKVFTLLQTLQRSVREMCERNKKFADASLGDLYSG
jgi:hypothetical protein